MPRQSERKELRERIAALSEEVRKSGADPFNVDVQSILRQLRKDFDKLKEDEMISDARAINSISNVVYMQDRWVSEHLLGLRVHPEIVEQKLKTLSKEAIADCLYSSQHLPCAVRHISTLRLKDAADYWIALMGWGKKASLGSLPEIKREDVEILNLNIQDLEKEIEDMRRKLKNILNGKPVPYTYFLEGLSGKERLRVSYLISLLCARGEVTIRFDPSSSAYVIIENGGVPDSSVGIQI